MAVRSRTRTSCRHQVNVLIFITSLVLILSYYCAPFQGGMTTSKEMAEERGHFVFTVWQSAVTDLLVDGCCNSGVF